MRAHWLRLGLLAAAACSTDSRRVDRTELARAAVDGSPILASTLLPAAVLLLGRLDVMTDQTARVAAIVVAGTLPPNPPASGSPAAVGRKLQAATFTGLLPSGADVSASRSAA